MKLGIIGLPQSGKTTLFNALTHGRAPLTASVGRVELHQAVVDVHDPRVDALAAMFKARKATYAKITYVDIAGLEAGAAKTGFSGTLLNQLSQMDGFLLVVRCFEDENVPHPLGHVDPTRDIEVVEGEFLLNDLIMVERKLERLAEERKKGATDKALNARQTEFFERLHRTLSEGKPLRHLQFTAEQQRELSSFGLLTRKPILIIFNVGEGKAPPSLSMGYPSVAVQGKLEMEIAQLPPGEMALFLREFGIEKPMFTQIGRLAYDMLDMISFLTTVENEVRAWPIRRGATALEAAGAIHTDLQKGFIRAEVIAYEDLIRLGSMHEAKQKGKVRLEGKEYIVQDGDVLYIRFNV